jgi:outer membrane protein assembly factor BamD (BamD/ComL family)
MKKSIFVFFTILLCITLIPAVIFCRSTSVEDAQYSLAIELFKTGRYSEAIVEFDRLLKVMKTKKYADACYYYIGSSYYYKKNYRKAKPYFEWIVKRHRTSRYHGPSLYLLGRCELLQENYTKSIRLFDDYVKKYPRESYADNSLYWKGEALLDLDRNGEAKVVFEQLLKRYPYGNKADAARFKLRLMELEKRIAGQKEVQEKIPEAGEGAEAYLDTIAGLKENEESYKSEIEKLNDQIDHLKTQVNTLKELAEVAGNEQDKIRALTSWENVLGLKEQALREKENELDREYDLIMQVKKQIEGSGYE